MSHQGASTLWRGSLAKESPAMSASSSRRDVPSPADQRAQSAALAIDSFPFPLSQGPPRVLSVSAHGHELRLAPVPEPALDLSEAESVSELRALVQDASSLIQKLRLLREEARHDEEQATRTVVHLQDRLRLGAEMVKAFQMQIHRIEESMSELKAQERRVEAAGQRILEQASQALAEIAAALAEAETLRLHERGGCL
jgi:hypothetical protein